MSGGGQLSLRFHPVVGGVCMLFYLLLCMQIPVHAASPGKSAVSPDGPDADVKQFRLHELEARLQTMQPGSERDYFAGVLANRTGSIAESIQLLNGALPGLRKTHALRAAIALEALADDYNKSFRYADAAQTYDDLL